jgi:hypothetical protein
MDHWGNCAYCSGSWSALPRSAAPYVVAQCRWADVDRTGQILVKTFDPYLGDYDHLVANGTMFFSEQHFRQSEFPQRRGIPAQRRLHRAQAAEARSDDGRGPV